MFTASRRLYSRTFSELACRRVYYLSTADVCVKDNDVYRWTYYRPTGVSSRSNRRIWPVRCLQWQLRLDTCRSPVS